MFGIDQLRDFVAVAEELHFGRAADRLQVTQPPLSRQLQKLERTVGARLLERDNRKVALTAAGAVFLDEARRLLTQAEGAWAHTRRIEAGAAGTVRIGFTAASACGVLTQVLDQISSTLQVSQVLSMISLVAGGRGIALVPASATWLRDPRGVARSAHRATSRAGRAPHALASRGQERWP
ncbi:MAG TPA: LysR family transcriptional regulator [Microlunatus sp.]